jgi:3-oxoadipate enol-lactonase
VPYADEPGLTAPRIYYELSGADDAPALVLIKGLTRSLLHWAPLVPELGAFRVVLLDNRGVGRSGAVRLPFSVADMARDVTRVLDHAGIERAHIFGMSLGGMVAQRVAIEHPSRVDRLVLGCTTPGGRNAEHAKFAIWLGLVRARVRGKSEAMAAEARLLLSDGFLETHPEVLERWIRISNEQPVRPATLAMQVIAALRHQTEDELHRITAPTLIVSSDSDLMIPPSNSRLLARRIRGSEIAWVTGTGHDFATERPAETASMLSTFLL